uniref:Jacalin-type lectin domain-containing protein n=2 Tax=Zea mays TaxID=4577 RepID=A0A804MMA1_MAIZE
MDITETSKHLESITVCTGVAVHSIAFSYVDYAGEKHSTGRWGWGGSGGQPETIHLAKSEVVTELSGTIGKVDDRTVITSIKFVTNLKKTYGPWGAYGDDRDTQFIVPMQPGSGIVGFFGHAGDYLDAIGIYARAIPTTTTTPVMGRSLDRGFMVLISFDFLRLLQLVAS